MIERHTWKMRWWAARLFAMMVGSLPRTTRETAAGDSGRTHDGPQRHDRENTETPPSESGTDRSGRGDPPLDGSPPRSQTGEAGEDDRAAVRP
jgi:hypothetical protein